MIDRDLETAREIVDGTVGTFESVETRGILVSHIAAALKAARAEGQETIAKLAHEVVNGEIKIAELEAKLKSVEVSDEEIERLSIVNCEFFSEGSVGFVDGFRRAQELRAKRMWPSEDEAETEARKFYEEVMRDPGSGVGFLRGFHWAKKQMCETTKEK